MRRPCVCDCVFVYVCVCVVYRIHTLVCVCINNNNNINISNLNKNYTGNSGQKPNITAAASAPHQREGVDSTRVALCCTVPRLARNIVPLLTHTQRRVAFGACRARRGGRKRWARLAQCFAAGKSPLEIARSALCMAFSCSNGLVKSLLTHTRRRVAFGACRARRGGRKRWTRLAQCFAAGKSPLEIARGALCTAFSCSNGLVKSCLCGAVGLS